MGDQEKYRAFYLSLVGVELSEIPILQFRFTGSWEPLYGLIMWSGSNVGVDKDVYISFFNCILYIALFVFLSKHRASPLFIVLMFLNFYFIVLLTGAERLKFAYLALLFVALVKLDRSKAVLLTSSILSHFSALLIWLGLLARRLAYVRILRRVNRKVFGKRTLWLFLAVILGVFVSILFGDTILYKIQHYWLSGSVASLLNVSILFILTFLLFKKRSPMLLALTFCSILIFLIGPERMNMIAVTIFIYQVIIEGKTNNPAVLTLMLYFAVKSVPFVEKVLVFGNGFANI
tara:strand:+ start:261 stop:1130 length:870 start_codon:yes stop_codon:yes gene_type:complete